MNKSLYCYKLNSKTGVIVRYKVDDYEIVETKKGCAYKFKAKFGSKNIEPFCVKENQLDELRYEKYYTFDSDVNAICKKIYEEFKLKATQAHREYIQMSFIANCIKENFPESYKKSTGRKYKKG